MNRDAETLARVNLGTGQTKSPLKLVVCGSDDGS